jgi:hypothetical protein
MSNSMQKIIRYALGTLLLFVALNALGGGYYGIMGARDVPLEWLDGTPFHNYFIPSLILFLCVGGSALFAAIAVYRYAGIARKAAFVCGAIVIVWLSVQVGIIGYVSWMQPVTAGAALLILFLAWLLHRQDGTLLIEKTKAL